MIGNYRYANRLESLLQASFTALRQGRISHTKHTRKKPAKKVDTKNTQLRKNTEFSR